MIAQSGSSISKGAYTRKPLYDDQFVRRKAAQVIGYYTDSREPLNQLSRIAEEIGREMALEETRAFIAHEVRSAIGPLKGFASLLEEALSRTDLDKEALEKYIRQIIKQTDLAYEIVEQYVDYSRPITPSIKSTDIVELLSQCLEEIRPRCQTDNIEILWRAEHKITIGLDAQLIAQVLRNVMANAIEAVERDGRITISAREEEGRVMIIVSDTGPGIKPEHQNRIFELGFTTKLGKHGGGVGLALARRIVEEGHRGKISINNNVGERGATVTIELPLR